MSFMALPLLDDVERLYTLIFIVMKWDNDSLLSSVRQASRYITLMIFLSSYYALG